MTDQKVKAAAEHIIETSPIVEELKAHNDRLRTLNADLLAVCKGISQWLRTLQDAFPCLDWDESSSGYGGWEGVDATSTEHVKACCAAIAKAEKEAG